MNLSRQTKSSSDYARRVRGLAHGLWSADIEPFAFVDGMVDLLFRNYEIAWQEGAALCDVTLEERTPEELDKLRREVLADQGRIMGYADFIVMHSKALGFKYETVTNRAELWANRYKAIVTLAQLTSCSDQKMRWRYGATEEHCLSGGTPILTRDGWRPIKRIRKGDEVQTMLGWRRVTKTTRNAYLGAMYRVGAVLCTAGHRFLTENGWIKAKDLGDLGERHLRFPYANDGETAGRKVAILGAITSALRILTGRERSQPRVTVPVVAISLDDHAADPRIHDELGFYEVEGLVFNLKQVEIRKQRPLQLGRLVLLYSALALKELLHVCRVFLGMILTPLGQLQLDLRPAGWIVPAHVAAGGTMYFPPKGAGPELQSKDIGAVAKEVLWKTKTPSDTLFGFEGIVSAENTVLLSRPDMDGLRAVAAAAQTELGTPVAQASSTSRTQRGRPNRSVTSRGRSIATDNPAESRAVVVRINSADECLSAFLATNGSRGIRSWLTSGHCLLRHIVSRMHILPDKFAVYNLEVEEAHHFIAAGIVVHNCEDCASYAGRVYRASVWAKWGAVPRSRRLACGGFRCDCRLDPTKGAVTPGHPPGPSGGF